MEEKTFNDVMEQHLEAQGYTPEERKKLMKAFKEGKKEVQNDRKEKEKEDRAAEKDRAKCRHGTTCVGIIGGGKTIVEF